MRRAVKLIRLLMDPLWIRGLRYGVAASVEHRRLPIDPATRTVLDVGANRGQFALYATRRCPEAVIHCFEPLPGPSQRLRRMFDGNPRVRLHQTALGRVGGTAPIHISARDDSSSLLPIGQGQVERFPGTQETAQIDVPVARLDSMLGPEDLYPPVLLKLDVQGFELDVLEGATGYLPIVSQVLVECSFVEFYVGQPLFRDIHAWLDQRGFVLSAAASSARDASGNWLQADMLYHHPSPS